jgi:Icc-related predicted phosphoesterase
MKIVAISDTHNNHRKVEVPKCDILLHCGDWTSMGRKYEVEAFAKWLDLQEQAEHIVVVPGNHELDFETHVNVYDSYEWLTDHCPRVHVLIDRTIEIEGVKIHGSPATPYFCDWAWNRMPSEFSSEQYVGQGKTKTIPSIKPHWDMIPEGTNILITHGPPYDILDRTTFADGTMRPEPLGCPLLLKRIQEVKPALHFFGHIHYPGGTQVHKDGTSFYNAAICDEHYYPGNPLTIVDYIKEEG